MIALINFGKRDMRLRPIIGKIIKPCAQKDYFCYAKKIHDYWTHEIKYAYDPVDVELIEDAFNSSNAGIADCDSKCIGFCSFCEQIGLPCRLVTYKTSATSDEYLHVASQVKIPGKGWVTSDCTMPKHEFGWSPPESMPSRTWTVSKNGEDGEALMMSGLGYVFNQGRRKGMRGLGFVAELACACSQPLMGLGYGDSPCVKCASKNGLGAMGDISSTVQDAVNGTTKSSLVSARTRSLENLDYTYRAVQAAQSSGDPRLISSAAISRQDALRAKGSLDAAISKYNELASAITTYSGGYYSPGMAGLGAVQSVVALAAIGAVAVIAASLAAATAMYYSDANASMRSIDSYGRLAASLGKAGVSGGMINDIFNTLKPSPVGGITSSIGTVLLLGALGFVGYKVAIKRGLV